MDRKVAEDICYMVDGIFEHMQILNNYVVLNCEDASSEKAVHVLTFCVSKLDLEILEPIYREYPDLKPAFLP
jgi:hypothetical protein